MPTFRISKSRPSLRAALVAAGLATILSPLLFAVTALVLFESGLLLASGGGHMQASFEPVNLAILCTLIACIPELIWGSFFGSAFPVWTRGGRLRGAISGAVFWSFNPATPLIVWAAHGSWSEYASSAGQARHEFLVVLPVALWLKELCTGLIVGTVIGGFDPRRGRPRNEGET